MTAVSNKELLSWYLITLKLRQTVESRLASKSIYGGANVPDHEPRPPESEWIISIKEKLEQGRQDDVPGSWAKLSIYRFPHYLKQGGDKAWVPQIVSLGPYHHGERHHCHMDQHKWRCLHHILKRSHHEIGLYLDSVKKVEKRARACYEGTMSMNSNEFVEMMVLDGCFVIELLRGFTEGFKALGYPRNDPVFSMRGSMHKIQWDLIMLENQIPLFILDRLFGLQLGNPKQKGRVAKLVLQFFDSPMPTGDTLTISRKRLEFDPLYDQCKLHCLEVFRWSLLPSGPKWAATQRRMQGRQQLIHGVRDLWEAGIVFKKRQTDKFWEIQFKDGILHIPPIVVHDGTRSLFLNLIAFEQCHFNCSNHITSYLSFMDNLINSYKDVGYLQSRGIMEHWLGSNAEVAKLFNELCQEVAFNIKDSYLYGLSVDVNKYYSFRWNAWIASLRHKYLSNPWAIVSLFAAFILLVLTFTQTFYGVYSHYRPGS